MPIVKQDREWWPFLYLVLKVTLVVVSAQRQPCGVVGTDTGELVPNRNRGFYLNTQNPAPCNGTVNSFQYCYYHTDRLFTFNIDSYDFTFAVFRETSPGSRTYSAVSDVFTTGRTDLDSRNFACQKYQAINPVQIEAGDVIGACIYNPPEEGIFSRRVELVIVGQTASADQYLMMTDGSGCGDFTVPNYFSISSLNKLNSNVLHVSGSITPFSTMDSLTTHAIGTSAIETSHPPPMDTTPISPTVGISPPNLPTVSHTEITTEENFQTSSYTISSTDNKTITTTPNNQLLSSADNSGVIVGLLAILLLLLVGIAVTVIIIVVVKRRKIKISTEVDNGEEATTQNGIDNAVYCVYEGSHCSDSKIVQQTPMESENPTYDVERTYEYTDVISATNKSLQDVDKEKDIYSSVNAYEVPASKEGDIYEQLKAWKVPHIHRNEVEAVGHLGSGQFGSVEQGVWKRQGTRPVDVALKSLTKTSEEDKVKFLQEAAIMAQFRHPNVIVLHGMITEGDPIMIVAELARRGDLRNFLHSIKQDEDSGISAPILLKFSQQVALGMQYLSAKGFVHRDLAARNILVTNDYICKIADFGMSRDLADESYYVSRGGMIPVKWTAPEAIHYKKYSIASDVWSYGCLLYEIWSVGRKPFENYTNNKVLQLVDSGMRLPPPPGTPRTVYELMVNCWHPETSQRPSFHDIVLTLVGSKEMVLNIPEEDSSTNPLAGVLGAPLEAGENMYSELQRRHK